MSDDSGPEKTSTATQSVAHKKRFLQQTVGVVALIVLGGVVIWLGRKPALFSAVWQKARAFLHLLAMSGWFMPLGLAVVGLIAIILLWKLPQWQVEQVQSLEPKERFDRVNEARKTLATILGGIVLLAGFFGTWQNLKVAQENLRVSQEGQITDRFTKAIEQLGATDNKGNRKIEVRLGGIYSLEAIANEAVSFHWPVVEVLCTYVRNVAPWPRVSSPGKNQGEHPEPDIQAIITVLGRRDRNYERPDQSLALTDVNLIGADLHRANLSWAALNRTNLSRANLIEADLSRTFMRSTLLNEANLSGADLRGADLRGAVLYGAYLYGADLQFVKGLTQEQIDQSKGGSTTKLPANLHMPESWKK